MAAALSLDAFGLCWSAISMESSESSVFFNEKHCLEEETRDVNFDKVENRLAYMYKFGCYNILFVEKCIDSFLAEYSEAENIFSRENVKICSLSNGPGLDLIGLLCALHKSDKYLKCFPILKMINLYNSWWNIFKKIVTTVYQFTSSDFYNYFDIPSEIIHLIQDDIYSTLSQEGKDCIKDSDVLLMLKVFASTKATSDVVEKSMKEIFSLLKPGSFVFFIGSKKNTKELLEDTSLSNFVNCVHGPTKITIKDLHFEEIVAEAVGAKPKDSGHAYFIVWQKRETVIVKKQKSRRKKKKKSNVKPTQEELTGDCTVSNELKDCSDAVSELSYTSDRRQSGTSTELKSVSHENILQSVSSVEMSGKNSRNQSYENLMQVSTTNMTIIKERLEVRDENKHDLHSLIQRCESLVVSLEKLTANFKDIISLKNNRNSKCCKSHTCAKFRIPQTGIHSCCINIVHSDCCRRVCNCHTIYSSNCAICTK